MFVKDEHVPSEGQGAQVKFSQGTYMSNMKALSWNC